MAGMDRRFFAPPKLIVIGFLVGFIFIAYAFVRDVRAILAQPISAWSEDITADCAVVLTGGPNRIREGIDLLTRKAVQKLIISGVHPHSQLRDMFPHLPYYGEVREQDIILERRSKTTFGNAQQTLPLVEALRCRDLIVITSRTHMHRALQTFKAEFPSDFRLLTRAVPSNSLQPAWDELMIETVKTMFYGFWAF